MARTPQFDLLSRAFRKSLFLSQNPGLKNALHDFEGSLAENAPRDRRNFIKSTLALGLTALPFAALATDCSAVPRANKLERSDGGLSPEGNSSVVVLGGGVAGLTAAYRLGQSGVHTEIYEAQSRLGGRIMTRDRFNKDGMFCEIGGELIDSSHEEILALAKELGVKVDDFRPYDALVKKHQFYFGGQRYFDTDLSDACGPMADRLLKDMSKVFVHLDDRLVTYKHHTPDAVTFDRMSLGEYLHSMTDVDPWVKNAVEMAYLTEFGLDSAEQSSINLMTLVDPERTQFGIYGESDEAMRIHGGNSRLIEALEQAVRPSSKVHLDHQLVKIAETGSGIELTFRRGSKTKVIQAARVVCTIPFTILRDIEGIKQLDLSPTKQKAIADLGYGTNMKHMVGFKERLWRKTSQYSPGWTGYTFTEQASQTLWDTSRAQHGNSGIITTFLGGTAGLDPARGSLQSILDDLEVLCPGTRHLHDGNHALIRWGKHPFAKGSYACPRPGQYTELVGAAKEPELGGKLIFAGEHVSERYQGYMNGAVQSANDAFKTLMAQLDRSGPVRRRAPARV